MLNDIRKLIGQYACINEADITYESSFSTDLGLSSIDQLQMLAQLEEKFHIEIEEEDFPELSTVRDLVEYLTVQTSK